MEACGISLQPASASLLPQRGDTPDPSSAGVTAAPTPQWLRALLLIPFAQAPV